MATDGNKLVELNVGGVYYTTTLTTLLNEPDSFFVQNSSDIEASLGEEPSQRFVKDSRNKIFIDRDGLLFRYVLDYLRNDKQLVLPENFNEKQRLKQEAEYFNLNGMIKALEELETHQQGLSLSSITLNNNGMNSLHTQGTSPSSVSTTTSIILDRPMSAQSTSSGSYVLPPIPQRGLASTAANGMLISRRSMPLTGVSCSPSYGYILIGYRGTFSNGRDGMNDVKFRKISRILVCGRVQLCREVFGETLNENRDPDHGVSDRYTSRYYLKHVFLEQAFDTLLDAGFHLTCCGATGANSGSNTGTDKEKNINVDSEENKWLHYNEYVFVRYP